ncbi:MAG TPA: uroporphyrinogen decarboxylase family protein, partial [Tepidisphaeraceae bacterium]|nr:uroporphyrinogen decarboxylase family protein [Tepidisphaeraceae bacterium]
FWRSAGYDYVQCTVFVPAAELDAAIASNKGSAASHGSELRVIHSHEHFRSRRWSWQSAADGDLSAIRHRLHWLAELVKVLPPGMKIVLHTADVFTLAWEMIGFDEFCLASLEEPNYIRDVMDSLAAAQLAATTAALDVAGQAIGAVFYSDDIAYTEGLFLSPRFYSEFLFPTMRSFAQLGQRVGAPMIYHSDGRLYDVLEDLAAAGVRGIQPLEPKSMDPLEIQRRWPGRFCLMGNIDLDLMSRGSEADVERHVRDRIDRLNPAGGYMPGVSNTVPYYVKFENYQRMIQTVHSYAD